LPVNGETEAAFSRQLWGVSVWDQCLNCLDLYCNASSSSSVCAAACTVTNLLVPVLWTLRRQEF